MGDMADDYADAGFDTWLLHLSGGCGEFGPCQYCDEEALLEEENAARGPECEGWDDDAEE